MHHVIYYVVYTLVYRLDSLLLQVDARIFGVHCLLNIVV